MDGYKFTSTQVTSETHQGVFFLASLPPQSQGEREAGGYGSQIKIRGNPIVNPQTKSYILNMSEKTNKKAPASTIDVRSRQRSVLLALMPAQKQDNIDKIMQTPLKVRLEYTI